MNEGEYLDLVNDLKAQYDAMKERYEKRIAFLQQNRVTNMLTQEVHMISAQVQYYCQRAQAERI